MPDHLYGIIGTVETTEEMIDSCLSELRDAADAEGEAFWFIIGLTPDTPEIMGTVFEWLTAQDVTYDIVIHPDVADALPDAIKDAAGKVTKIKTVEKKVVDRLLAEGGTALLFLAGEDGDNSEEIQKQAQRFFDEGNTVFALDDANNSIDFGADTKDVIKVDAAEEDIDFEALGAAADEGDDDAVAKLTELGAAVSLNVDDHSDKTWAEFAELVAEATDTVEAEEKEAKQAKGATKKAASSKGGANAWTQKDLEEKQPKELREIAKAAGIENYGRLGVSALITALIGKPTGGEATAEPEEKAKPAARASRAKKTAAETDDSVLDAATSVAVAKALIQIAEAFLNSSE